LVGQIIGLDWDITTPTGVPSSAAASADAKGVQSLEVRWLQRGSPPLTLIERLGPFREPMEEREDHYLINPPLPQLGIKVRGTVQLDLKAWRGSPGELSVPGGRGRLERWEKWSFSLADANLTAPASLASAWLAVAKSRRRRFFAWIGGRVVERPLEDATMPGCSIELTEVLAAGEVWWTLGFEATGPARSIVRCLNKTAAALLPETLAPELGLDPEHSMSYPTWLHSSALRGRSPVTGDESGGLAS